MKNTPVRYSPLSIVLLPILLFNIGVQTFHNCNNLIHQHDKAVFDISHDKCLGCEVKQHPYEDISLPEIARNTPVFSVEYTPLIVSIEEQNTLSFCNRGPPALL